METDPRCDERWLVDQSTVRCIRDIGHKGRHIARDPAKLGEFVYPETTEAPK